MVNNNNDIEKILNSIDELNEKVLKFSTILERFGLDFITKLGQTTLSLKALTDKIDEVNKATISIKALSPQLSKIIENQDYLESELDLIKSLIQKSAPSNEVDKSIVERDESATEKKISIVAQLNELKNNIGNIQDVKTIKEKLSRIKEDIFEFTGGHRILYEISQFINILKEDEKPTEYLYKKLRDKIGFWMNKL